jgi:putative spermidine/putrescine transport system substrate-binding protein
MRSTVRLVRGGARGRRAVVAAAALALLASACGGSSSGSSAQAGDSSGDKKVTITYAGFGGSFGDAETKAYIEPFEKLHPNIKVLYDPGVDFAKLKAMVEVGKPTWDVFTGDLYAPDPSKYFEKLDCSIIPCDEIVKNNNVSDYVSVYYLYANVLTYNKAKFGSNPPSSWADMFDTQKYPGKRAFPGSATDLSMMVAAEQAMGIPSDKVYPIDVDKALAQLDKIKKDIVYYDTNQQCPQMVNSGQATMGLCLNGRDLAAVKDGAKDLAWSWNQPQVSYGAVAIPKGVPADRLEAAQQFIAFMLDKDQNGKLSDYIAYGPTNSKSTYANPQVKEDLPSSHMSGDYVSTDWSYLGSEAGQQALKAKATWRSKG